MDIDPRVDDLCERIIGCAIKVHTHFGAGLLESVYRDALALELLGAGESVEREHRVRLTYAGRRLRVDLFVGGLVVVEAKTVAQMNQVHLAQLITYVTLTNAPAGLLLNFNVPSLRAGGIRRIDHPEIYKKRRALNLTARFSPAAADPEKK
jgi:GxxExxY protein